MWDAKTSDCLHEFRPTDVQAADVPVAEVVTSHRNPDHIVVVLRSNTLAITNYAGQVGRAGTGHVCWCVRTGVCVQVRALADAVGGEVPSDVCDDAG